MPLPNCEYKSGIDFVTNNKEQTHIFYNFVYTLLNIHNLKRILYSVCIFSIISCYPALAQRQCGFEITKAALIAKDPAWAQKLQNQKASLQSVADSYKKNQLANRGRKTTAVSAIPVIFHYLVTNAQLLQLGGIAGVQQRVDSQMAVINRDFNRQNLDSALIPSGWKPLFASTGIRFGLAHTDPSGHGTPGYDIKIIPNSPGGFSGASSNYSNAKHASTGGTDSWDVNKYLNIWCTNFTDFGGLLGLTTYKSGTGVGGFPLDEEGVVLNYAVVGKRVSSADYYIPTTYHSDYYDQGRTLTHELGHFFEIWHTWGDDGGFCPWNGGFDDGLGDTPPEGDSKYFAYPYTIAGGTYRDSCHLNGSVEQQPYGAASLDFMNYTDDVAMQLFTPDQAAVMASMVLVPLGENYALTQHPELLNWSPITGVNNVPENYSLSISPNPTSGIVYITFNENTDELQKITVTDIFGKTIYNNHISGSGKSIYSIDLSGYSKGIYLVRCNFASGSITRKISLQ